MEPQDPQVRELRRVLRDLVALATMPASWVGREPGHVAGSVADLLLHTLRADAAYVRLRAGVQGYFPPAIRAPKFPDFAVAVDALPFATVGTSVPLIETVAIAGWPAPLRIVVHPVGLSGEAGFVAVASRAPSFPDETESLLLSVAANQAAVALQTARLLAERRLAEEAVRESHRKTTRVLESISDGFIAFDRNWCITYVNDIGAQFLQRRPEQLLGRNLWQEYPDIVGTNFELQYRAALETNQTIHFEEFYAPLDAWFELHLYPGPEGLSIFFRDVNERKLAQEALLRAEKLAVTGKLAASIAHEINNPLESVVNLLFLARSAAGEGTKTYTYLEVAEREINRVAHIARQTLGFYRDSSDPVWVQVENLLEDVLSVYRSRLESRGIRVEAEFQARRTVLALKGELHQVFSNLVANAIDAMEEGGVLRVSTGDCQAAGGQAIRIVIQDTGTGVLPEHLPKIFEPFFTTKKAVGTGLGLWVVRQIIENHGGTIDITSDTAADHHGTSVAVLLPLAGKLEALQSLASMARVM